jgi:glycosyltransferase involved in cell wall biosynthesis
MAVTARIPQPLAPRRRLRAIAAPKPLRVAAFTTSYPRDEHDFAGRFVADLVTRLRERGVEVDVVKPGDYRDYGLAYGSGLVRNVKRRPWAAPLMLLSMLRALRRAARDADLVHVHWLLATPLALLSGRPFVVTLHGTPSAGALEDLVLLRRAGRVCGPLLRRARTVICVSQTLADAVTALGANAVVVPNGVDIPDHVVEEPEAGPVLFAGRLAEEKGIEELVAATEGMNLVVAGDGPLRHLVPDALGIVPHDELERLYDASSVFVLPSRSEGFGIVAAEAMAHGRPVVACGVGGPAEVVADGETGILVPPRRPDLLRAAIERLQRDPELRRRLGRAGRERAERTYSWDAVVTRTLDVYAQATAVAPATR